MKRITNEQREAIVRDAIAKRDALAASPQPPAGQQAEPTDAMVKALEDCLFHLEADMGKFHPVCVQARDALAASPQAPSGQQAEPSDELTSFQRDLLRNLGASMAAERSRENGDAWEQLAELLRALAGQQSARPAPAGQVRPFAEVVQHNQGRYFTCLAAPGVDQPAIGAKVYLAAPAGQAVGELRAAIFNALAEARTIGHVKAKGYETDKAQRAYDAALERLEAALASLAEPGGKS